MTVVTEFSDLSSILRFRGRTQTNDVAFRFLSYGQNGEENITFGELDRRAASIADLLIQHKLESSKVLLIYPPGIDFIAAFFGCLYAGVVAVPVSLVREKKASWDIIEKIANDSGAKAILSNSTLNLKIHSWMEAASLSETKTCIATDCLSYVEQSSSSFYIDPRGCALLQYTSGSTGSPKGVVVTHENIIHNQQMLNHAFEHTSETVIVGWLPHYHDMGLIFNLLHPVYIGVPCIFMAPTAFVQQPYRWLEAISKYGGTTSGGPNFAYDLCVKNVKEEQLENLDLSSWSLAFNGAETVRKETLDRFSKKFAACGFNQNAHYPCYGLAEATLFVTGPDKGTPARFQEVSLEALKKNKIEYRQKSSTGQYQTVASCGHIWGEQELAIVNPESGLKVKDDEVGEVWIKGKSISQGYYKKGSSLEDSINASHAGYLSDSGDGPYLKTGDLGFCVDGDLYFSGRIKELVLIRGQNFYPQDIERVVQESNDALVFNGGAAFSIEVGGDEKLVVVQEVKRTFLRKLDVESVYADIAKAISAFFGIQIHAIALVKPATLLKTSSGKIRRNSMKQNYINNELKGLIVDSREEDTKAVNQEESAARQEAEYDNAKFDNKTNQESGASYETISHWLTSWVHRSLQQELSLIDKRKPFAFYGMDSIKAMELVDELGAYLQKPIESGLAWDYPSIELMARYLSGQSNGKNNSGAETDSLEDAIAVIGVACRFPGDVQNKEDYWKLLCEGKSGIVEVPSERWSSEVFYDGDEDAVGKMYSKHGGFIPNIDTFDAAFFDTPPRVADVMDPQQRLLLESCWHAFESAGIDIRSLVDTKTGCFIGFCSDDYARLQDYSQADYHASLGGARSIAAGRIANYFGFQGPAVQLDSSCASSLQSVHLACQSLRLKESDLAVAGGVNLIISPENSIQLSRLKALSKQGLCRTFDADADGYVRGEGLGLVILKRYSEAVKDGDPIIGRILGSAVNHDGFSNGLTAPNGRAQQKVIEQALTNAGVKASELDYIEAHGTGTPLGDPIEVQALGRVFKERKTPLLIGSVKTNIGHLEGAAGIAGFIKTLLALHHKKIPSTIHFQRENPHIDWQNIPVEVATSLRSWPESDRPKRAGVSAFGFSGTNVHMILEEVQANKIEEELYQDKKEKPTYQGHQYFPYILPLSAKTENALLDLAKDYKKFLAERQENELTDICLTAAQGRVHFSRRLCLQGDNKQQLQTQLDEFIQSPKTVEIQEPKIAYFISGSGVEFCGMGKSLYETQAVYREAFDRCETIMLEYTGQSLKQLSWEEESSFSNGNSPYQLPALFATQYALSCLWCSLGVSPNYLFAHNDSVYTAAVIAGSIQLEDAFKLLLAYMDYRLSENKTTEATSSREEYEKLAHSISYSHAEVPILSSVSGTLLKQDEVDAELFIAVLDAPLALDAAAETVRDEDCSIIVDISPKPGLSALLNTEVEIVNPSLGQNDFWGRLLSGVGQCYAKGANINWSQISLPFQFKRVALPTYPFQGKRFWHDRNAKTKNHALTRTQLTLQKPASNNFYETSSYTDSAYEDWLYKISWEKQALFSGEMSFNGGSAAFLPQLDSLQSNIEIECLGLFTEEQKAEYQQGQQYVECLSAEYVFKALAEIGFDFENIREFSAQSIINELGVASQHEHLFSRLLQILEERDILEKTSSGWRLVSQVKSIASLRDLENDIEKAKSQYPLLTGELDLLLRCGAALSEVIKGNVNSLDVLFPQQSTSNNESVYEQLFIYRNINATLAKVLYGALADVPKGQTVRILEIGAGTGATTANLLPVLQDRNVEYTFTDISSYFLEQAKTKFKRFSAVEYSLLNVEQEPKTQGYEAQSYDIVIAANVLHATKDLHQTLSNVRTLIKPEGLMLLVEGNKKSRWLDLSFGLTEGWWRFEDRKLREDYCLLTPDQWRDLFREHDLIDMPPLSIGLDSPQSILLAKAAAEQQNVSDNTENTCVGTTVHWLVFVDDPADSERLIKACDEQRNNNEHVSSHKEIRCTFVYRGDDWHKDELGQYHICQEEPEHYLRLLRDLDSTPDLVLYNWESSFASLSLDVFSEKQSESCFALLYTVRALQTQYSSRSPSLHLLTTGAQVSTKERSNVLQQSALLGLAKVISLEHPLVWGGMIDLDEKSKDNYNCLIEELLVRQTNADGREKNENQVAYCDQERLVARLVADADSLTKSHVGLRADASYLITGGFGAIGFSIAEYFVANGARHIILVGRSGIKNDHQSETVDQWRKQGVCVEVISADVSDAAVMTSLFERVGNQGPDLGGIIHAAGQSELESTSTLSEAQFLSAFNAKAKSAWVLHRLSQNMSLDFFILMSSCSSIWGATGLAAYASACQFLDALADYRHSLGLPGQSLNWALWGGDNMVGEALGEQLQRLGLRPMEPEQAIQLLGQILGQHKPQQIIAKMDWKKFSAVFDSTHQATLLSQVNKAEADDAVKQTTVSENIKLLPQIDQLDELIKQIEGIVAETLGQTSGSYIPREKPFMELGIDSLMMIEVKNRIAKRFNLALPSTLLFDHPTLSKVADFILSLLNKEDVNDNISDIKSKQGEESSSPIGDKPADEEAVAIIGMGVRTPGGVKTLEEYWSLLENGETVISDDINPRLWPSQITFLSDKSEISAGVLEGIDQFDPEFFQISPKEVLTLDPQQRIALEVSWEALEHAGYASEELKGSKVGIFMGVGVNEYGQICRTNASMEHLGHILSGNSVNMIAGRIAYFLGVEGPCMSIDTACSSSMVAVDNAVKNIRTGACEMAIAGGVNLVLSEDGFSLLSEAQVLSPSGRCRAFDVQADGIVRSEACGVLILKKLSSAIADNDNIVAVIRGSEVNQDGRSSSLTAPNGKAQEALIDSVLENAKVKAHEVDWVETHGTGTNLGDPIEVNALANAYGKQRTKPLVISSQKSNIGHAEAASGVANIIKVALSLQNETIVKQANFSQLNPQIEVDPSALRIPTQNISWTRHESGHVRKAATSSFGFSGTNVHVILEEAPLKVESESEEVLHRGAHILLLSAKSESSLKILAERYLQVFERDSTVENDADELADICYTAAVGRSHFRYRLAITFENRDQAKAQLRDFVVGAKKIDVSEGLFSGVLQEQSPSLIFCCNTDTWNRQYLAFLQYLYENEYVFRNNLELCISTLQQEFDLSNLFEYRSNISSLNQFVLNYSLVKLCLSWGMKPRLLTGRGVGEYVAACVAGIINIEDALTLAKVQDQYEIAFASVSGTSNVQSEVQSLLANIQYHSADIPFIPADSVSAKQDIDWPAYWMTKVCSSKSSDEKPFNLASIADQKNGLVIEISDAFAVWEKVAKGDASHKEYRSTVAGDSLSQQWTFCLKALAQCYVSGLAFNWKQFEQAYCRGRVVLPSYPFDKQTYWISGQVKANAQQSQNSLPDSMNQNLETTLNKKLGGYLYQPRWKAEPLFMAQPLAGYVPSLKAIEDRLKQEDCTSNDEYVWQNFNDAWSELEELSVAYIVLAFQRVSILPHSASVSPIDTTDTITVSFNQILRAIKLTKDGQLFEDYKRLLRRFLEILCQYGVLKSEGLTEEGECWSVQELPSTDGLIEKLVALAKKYPIIETELDLLERCGEQLLEVLQGDINALELLFPQGGVDGTRKFYSDSILSQRLNMQSQSVVLQAVEQLPKTRGLRILEVGAGTGATSEYILRHLPEQRCHYTYTDISAHFTEQAREKFKEYSFIEYSVLDIEQDPSLQGFSSHHYDIVIAANVLHATKSIDQTLTHIRKLLASDGLLLLIEGTEKLAYQDITFGLTSGWWRFIDKDIRPDYPLMSSDLWKQSLCKTGFDSFVRIDDEMDFPQSVMLAKASPGSLEKINEKKFWLVFSDREYALGDELTKVLTSQKISPIVVQQGENFIKHSSTQYTLKADCNEDYDRLLHSLYKNKQCISQVVHLWSSDNEHSEDLSAADVASQQTLGCQSVLYLVQALDKQNKKNANNTHITQDVPRLSVVSRGIHGVLNNFDIDSASVSSTEMSLPGLGQSTLFGLCNVLSIEHPEFKIKHIDLGADTDINNRSQKVEACYQEIYSTGQQQHVTLLREQRYTLVLAPYEELSVPFLEQEALQNAIRASKIVKKNRSYLVVGGLTGLGMRMAEWLVERGAESLVLTGRRKASEGALGRISALEKNEDVNITVLQADVANYEQMAEVFNTINETLPPLAGVIHSAGVLDDGSVVQQNWSRFQAVLNAKMQGSWNLHVLSKSLPLDFFVLFSSMTALIGNIGQSSHAAANAFEDALVAYRQTLGLKGLSINWGPWSETGAAVQGNIESQFRESGIDMITPEEGITVMELMLKNSSIGIGKPSANDRCPNQIGVIALNWSRLQEIVNERNNVVPNLLRNLVEERKEKLIHNQDDAQEGASTSESGSTQQAVSRILEAPQSERSELMEALVLNQTIETMGLDRSKTIKKDLPLQELGLDSLMAMRLRDNLAKTLDLSLPASLLFDYPDICSLSKFLLKVLAPQESVSPGSAVVDAGAAEKDASIEKEVISETINESDTNKIIGDIQALSDEEADRLLDALFEKES